MLTEEPLLLEDAAIEALSTLEALDDITDSVEALVLSYGGEQERDAYFALADEYQVVRREPAGRPNAQDPGGRCPDFGASAADG